MTRQRIYFLMALVIIYPLLFPIGLIVQPTASARKLYDFVEALPPGSNVWMGFDFYASTLPETGPAAEAVLTQLFRRNCHVVITSSVPDGAVLSQTIAARVAQLQNKKYGEDYVILGYQTGSQIFLKQCAANFWHTFSGSDRFHRPLSELPMMASIHSAADLKLIFSISDNQTFEWQVQVNHTAWKVPVAGAITAVQVPAAMPYVNSGQALGVLGGLRGAAEYEVLVGIKGLATRGMDSQSLAHVLLVLLIVVANVLMARDRLKMRRNG